MSTRNRQLAELFARTADLLQLTDANRFKIIAYQKSARVLEDLAEDAVDMSDTELIALDGVGKGTVERIREFADSGTFDEYEELAKQIPAGVVAMLGISGLGPKTVALLWQQGGVNSIAELKEKLEAGELTDIKGFGKGKAAATLKSIAFAESGGDRTSLGAATALAERFMAALKDLDPIQQIEVAGSLRRGRDTIGDVDILVGLKEGGSASDVSGVFCAVDGVTEVIAGGGGSTKTSVRTDQGVQVDLRIVPDDCFGAALMYFSGSKEHNVAMRERAIAQGMKLNEWGLWKGSDGATKRSSSRRPKASGSNSAGFLPEATGGRDSVEPENGATRIAGKTEQDVFKALGLAWVAPELREARGEIKLAEADDLPKLVDIPDICAELHCHTTASDGSWSIDELVEACIERGYHTVCITDHSKSQAQANGLSDERLVEHIKAIHDAAKRFKKHIIVLAGSEVDILSDCKLDYPDELLAELDLVVASPHAALSQDDKKATKRLIKAIEHPAVNIIGHPTGRLVLRREGLHPEMKAICRAAADADVALEINANHHRLDLRDADARLAFEHAAKLAINTDAHGPGDMNELRFGIKTARRAGATPDDIVNCMSKAALAKWRTV